MIGDEIDAYGAIGHNSGQPADLVRDELGAALLAPGRGSPPKSFTEHKAELIASAGRAVVTDNDSVGRAGDLQAMISRLIEAVEFREREIVEPHVVAVAAGRTMREIFIADLVQANAEVRSRVDRFRADQRAKAAEHQRKQEEEERQRRAAVSAAASTSAPKPAVESGPVALPAVRGDYGSRTGDRKVKTYSWKDPRKVDLDVLNHQAVVKAMQQACRDLAKIKKTIKGVVITEDVATTVRKQ